MEKGEIRNYYDHFVHHQVETALNDRIFSLFKKTIRAGVNTHSSILELGCGIGAFSFLLSKVVRKGTIEAVDISADSIAFAENRIKKRNVFFKTGDIVHYHPAQNDYDFITLFDVIEHIPLSEHPLLFQNISRIMNRHTKLLIQIPNPRCTEYDRIHHPESMQIVDETVYINSLCNILYSQGLYLQHFQTYSIWVEDDYQYMVVRKNVSFEEVKLSAIRTFPEKIKARVKREFLKLVYRF
jgi:trans-aconitate 2-methyltransferase